MARRKGHNRGRHQQHGNPLYDPTAVLSGKGLRHAADALVRLQFQPQKAAINRASTNATTQGTALINNAGSYYQQLAKQAAAGVAREQAIGSKLQAQLAASSSESQKTMQAIAADAQGRMQADAVTRGPGLGGGAETQLAQETAAQAGLQTQQAQQARDTASQSSTDYQQLLDLSGRSTAARGGEIKQQLINQLANQQAGFNQQRVDLAGQMGAARTQQVTALRQTQLENLIAERGLGIKAQQLRADIATSRAEQNLARDRLTATERQNRRAARVQRRGQNVTRRGQDVSSQTQRRGQDISAQQRTADRRARERVARLKNQGMSTEAAKRRVSVDDNRTYIQTDPKTRQAARNNNWDRVRNRLIGKPDATPLTVQAAIELERFGYLKPNTTAALRRAGVKLPRGWRRGGAQAYPTPAGHGN